MSDDERIMMQNPNTGRDDKRIKVSIYEPVRDAVLMALADEPLPNAQLYDEVERRTPPELWQANSLMWFTTIVKLHLEATKLLTKKGSPQVLSITAKGRAQISSRLV